MAPKKSHPYSRHYIFTIHDVAHLETMRTMDFEESPVRYIAAQIETAPNTNKDHIQGYIEFDKPQRLTGCKRLLGCKSAHVEIRKGTRQQARDYALKTQASLEVYPGWESHGLRKEGTEPFEYGKWDPKMKSGKRTDLDEIWTLINKGATEYEILEERPKAYMMYTRGIRNARQMYLAKNQKHFREVHVRVNWGEAGTGKTRYAYDNYDPKEVFEVPSLDPLWMDGYSGQKVLLINEFYGQLKPSLLLKLLDGYRTQYAVKGGFITAEWDTVIITSNTSPRDWYSDKVPLEVKRAIARRIDIAEHFELAELPEDWKADPWAAVKETVRAVDSTGSTVSVKTRKQHHDDIYEDVMSRVAASNCVKQNLNSITRHLVSPFHGVTKGQGDAKEVAPTCSSPSFFCPGLKNDGRRQDGTSRKGAPT